MTHSDREKLEKQLKSHGYQQSNYDKNRWSNGTTNVNWDSKNGFNDNGTTYRGYGTCKDHLDKKKG